MTLLTAALLAALLDPLQEPAPRPQNPPPLQDGPAQDPAAATVAEPEMETSLVLIPRVSRIAGDLVRDNSIHYEDLWGTGFGLGAELDLMWAVGGSWRMGGYASLGADFFPGRHQSYAVADIWADDLLLTQAMLGFKARLAPDGGFYFDGRTGLGVAFYGETDARLTMGGPPATGTLLESSTTFAFEASAHAGYSTRSLIVALGLSVRQVGGPDQAAVPGADTGSPVILGLELEVAFRF